MSKGKLGKWINDNIVMLVGIPLIFGVHYGWSKLQKVPYLVDQTEEREVPIIAALTSIKNKMMEKFYLEGSNTGESEEK